MHVLVLAKEPVPGRVKTRLCPPCSPVEAAALAEAALADTLEAASRCGADRRIIALDGRPGDWLPEGFEVVPQVDGDLGARLDAAWAAAGGPGLQIGMDTPQVTGDILDDALATLATGDCSLGPAVDGGWWAIALRTPVPGLFGPVAMSRSDTGAAQRARCEELGLTVADLPAMVDVDHADDAVAVADLAVEGRFAAVVRDIGLRARLDVAAS